MKWNNAKSMLALDGEFYGVGDVVPVEKLAPDMLQAFQVKGHLVVEEVKAPVKVVEQVEEPKPAEVVEIVEEVKPVEIVDKPKAKKSTFKTKKAKK